MTNPNLAASTRAVVAGRPKREPDAPLNVPVTFASTYYAGGPMEYGRYGNPGWTAFEEAIGSLEGGSALTFSSGLAAVSAILALLPENAIVVAPDNAYTGTRALLNERVEQSRAKLRAVDVSNAAQVAEAAVGADLIWLESPTNPRLDIADIPAAAIAARANQALLVVDNTFATPILQRPIELGADLVVHSATKFLAGHSDVVLGITVTNDAGLQQRLEDHRRLHGAIPGPMEVFLALRGLRTLALRVERAQTNAQELSQRLADHPAVALVRYPGTGGMLSFEHVGGAAAAEAVAEAVELWIHATSLGGVESSLERRRRWPSEADTVSEGLLRLSVGIEDVADLWADLKQALDGTV